MCTTLYIICVYIHYKYVEPTNGATVSSLVSNKNYLEIVFFAYNFFAFSHTFHTCTFLAYVGLFQTSFPAQCPYHRGR